ncbi:hypothetical protein SAMN05421863_100349 [Nitrosomonas communis]|uniref:Uncharacterized protein n=1 Tax=Nitrosomonas communis TaxID=44574 RepID=A0A1I4K031_9PROT|nr:hypothetical protein SAMN05421863_100349 [Nitrosomonas communis]
MGGIKRYLTKIMSPVYDRVFERDHLLILTEQRKTANSIFKSKLTLSASPCRIIDTICGSPSRHF